MEIVYARVNRIGLTSPYAGNTALINITNQGVDSKYKDYTTNYLKLFKDVTAITNINNSTTPYFEYTNTGLGLIELTGNSW